MGGKARGSSVNYARREEARERLPFQPYVLGTKASMNCNGVSKLGLRKFCVGRNLQRQAASCGTTGRRGRTGPPQVTSLQVQSAKVRG